MAFDTLFKNRIPMHSTEYTLQSLYLLQRCVILINILLTIILVKLL